MDDNNQPPAPTPTPTEDLDAKSENIINENFIELFEKLSMNTNK